MSLLLYCAAVNSLAHVQPRHVAVSVPYRRGAEGIEICLVSSRKHDGRWVLPKGGIEEGESEAQAAIRELYEEGEWAIVTASRR